MHILLSYEPEPDLNQELDCSRVMDHPYADDPPSYEPEPALESDQKALVFRGMGHQPRNTGLPSYSPPPEHPYDPRHALTGARQPLRESAGNSQSSQGFSALSLCHGGELGLSPPLPPAIPTPILPSQVSGSSFGSSFNSRRHHQSRLQRKHRTNINPIYLSPQFRQYRDKQDQKEKDEEQKWPPVLEDAFLDGV